jgi:phosphoglycolate phosphatase
MDRLKAKGIFLDLDGTIVDSTGAYIEAAKIAFRAHGKVTPSDRILLEIPRRIEQHHPLDDLIGLDPKTFTPIYLKAYYSVTEAKTKLMPNVEATLQTLSTKAKLAVITMRHCPSQMLYKELDYLGIAKYLSHIVTSMDQPKPKPSPDALLHCAETFGLSPSDCIIAGDSLNDIRAGKAAGVKTVAVLTGLYSEEELAKEDPDLIIPDVTSLPKHVE